jgi:predicted RNA-binding protein with PUA-like domain
MNHFLVKTEPSTYSIDDFAAETTTIWDGVHNYQAINVIKTMKYGDQIYVYHSMKDKKIVGLAEVVGEPYENTEDVRYSWAVKMRLIRKVDGPSLSEFKQDSQCAHFKLVTHSRLSVMPVPHNVAVWINSRIS